MGNFRSEGDQQHPLQAVRPWTWRANDLLESVGSMNAIIYTRWSPRPNAATCESCETQKRICEEHAHKQGWTIAAVFDDPDRSGADGCREQLDAAIRSLKKGDVLLVYKWDRIARDLMLALEYERQIKARGASVVAVTGDVPGDNPHAQFTRHILMAVAELERKMIAERTRNSMRQLQRSGRRMSAPSRVPYGFRIDPADATRMIPDEHEKSIADKIVAFRNSVASYNSIAKMLNADNSTQARHGHWSAKVVRSVFIRATQAQSL
jgi:DNA invertase Pin-like site-specific DNA recombinase